MDIRSEVNELLDSVLSRVSELLNSSRNIGSEAVPEVPVPVLQGATEASFADKAETESLEEVKAAREASESESESESEKEDFFADGSTKGKKMRGARSGLGFLLAQVPSIRCSFFLIFSQRSDF